MKFGELKTVDLGAFMPALTFLLILGLFSANPTESAFAIIQFYMLLKVLWKQSTPPVALLLFLFPWLEISTGILEANLLGLGMNEMLHGYGKTAYWLSSIGLYCVLLGFIPFFNGVKTLKIEEATITANQYSLHRLILAYFATGPLLSVVRSFFSYGSSFYQFTTYFGSISTFLLIVIVIRQAVLKKAPRIYMIFLFIVTVLSFYSLFSSWKMVAFALFIGYGTISNITRKVALRIILFGAVFGNLIFLWQGVKEEYRFYITASSGTGRLDTQAVVVSRKDALTKFAELTQQFYFSQSFNEEQSNELLYRTLRRAGYLEFFSMTMRTVPEEIPHARGTLMTKNLTFALIPRFLNPNKGIKDDGAKVTKYTGFMVGENSSFSLGHYTEYFIDFGKVGMMIILFIYGVIGGGTFLFISKRSKKFVSNFAFPALAYIILSKWGTFQGDAIYVYGRTFFGAICHLFVFVPIYKLVERFCMPERTFN